MYRFLGGNHRFIGLITGKFFSKNVQIGCGDAISLILANSAYFLRLQSFRLVYWLGDRKTECVNWVCYRRTVKHTGSK